MRELTVKEVCKKQLEILSAVDAWCREHDVSYFLAYGTLLGAVRHQGYIPWDDDVDIIMPRADYERLLKEFNQNRTDNLRVLHSSIDCKFPYEFAKVSDISTKLVENSDVPYDMGINIDVFVLDAVGENKKNAAKIVRKLRLPYIMIDAKVIAQNKDRGMAKSFILAVAKLMFAPVPMSWCTQYVNRMAQMYRESDHIIYVADMCQRLFNTSQVLEKKWFQKEIELTFENRKFKAPAMYDEILTAWYGDYMQLPPEEQRITHHDYKAYARSF